MPRRKKAYGRQIHTVCGVDRQEITRVFKRLFNYSAKRGIEVVLQKLKRRRTRMHVTRNVERSTSSHKITDQSEDNSDEALATLNTRIAELEEKLSKLEPKGQDGLDKEHISPADMHAALKDYGKLIKRKKLDELIWLVDEDLDGGISLQELIQLYCVTMKEHSGQKGFSLIFHLVQFMMFDQDNSGFINIAETADILHKRHGDGTLKQEVARLFGNDEAAKCGDWEKQESAMWADGILTFKEYLGAVRSLQKIKEKQNGNFGKRVRTTNKAKDTQSRRRRRRQLEIDNFGKMEMTSELHEDTMLGYDPNDDLNSLLPPINKRGKRSKAKRRSPKRRPIKHHVSQIEDHRIGHHTTMSLQEQLDHQLKQKCGDEAAELPDIAGRSGHHGRHHHRNARARRAEEARSHLTKQRGRDAYATRRFLENSENAAANKWKPKPVLPYM